MRGEIDAVALLADGDLDAVVLRALRGRAAPHARFAQDRDSALLDDARAHSSEHVVAAAPFEHDAVDARTLEQLREQQARWPRADDADLSSCGWACGFGVLRQRVGDQRLCIGGAGVVYREPPGRDDRDVLAPVGRRDT